MGYFEEVSFQVPKSSVDFNLDITARAHSRLEKYTKKYKLLPLDQTAEGNTCLLGCCKRRQGHPTLERTLEISSSCGNTITIFTPTLNRITLF